jgi:hypothetical protein
MRCEHSYGLGWIAAWYFIIFIMIGVMVLVSLFTGVIITAMDLLRATANAERKVLEQAGKMQEKYGYDDQSFYNLLEIFEILDTDDNGSISVSLSDPPPPHPHPPTPSLIAHLWTSDQRGDAAV